MRGAVVLAVVILLGCSGLVVKKDDSTATKAAKVATRAPLAVVTFGASEGRVGRARNQYWAEEKRQENQAEWEAAVADAPDLVTMTQHFHNHAPTCSVYGTDKQMCVWNSGPKREEALEGSGNSIAVAPGLVVKASCIVMSDTGDFESDSCSVSFE